jgi:ElaB/YqjD/DUF883 family membrane-anchored ribosome-binding protein
MDDEPEVIRQQMKTTRSDLTQKIEALENQVVGTVQSTTQAVTDTVASVKEAVQETVSTVKDTVSGTVDTVKDALDVRGYVEQYPWASFGCAVAAGYVGGLLLGGGRTAGLRSPGEPFVAPDRGMRYDRRGLEKAARAARFTAEPAQAEPSWTSTLTSKFAPELTKLKGLALGAVGALVRDLVVRQTPGEVGAQLSEIIDDFTRKLGGEPIHGSFLPTGTAGAAAGGKSSRERDASSESHTVRASAGL